MVLKTPVTPLTASAAESQSLLGGGESGAVVSRPAVTRVLVNGGYVNDDRSVSRLTRIHVLR